MPYLGRFFLHEQFLGREILPDPLRPFSRHRIHLGSSVRKSLLGRSFPKPHSIPPWGGSKIQTWPKEATYRHTNCTQQRYRYAVTYCPTAPKYAAIWNTLSAAILSWRALTTEQKEKLDQRARQHNTMSGYNLHIREYIHANY